MKKLLIKLSIFALVFVAVDIVVGMSLSSLVVKTKGGDTGRNIKIVDKTTADIVLFGSSRCVHHYDPRIVADSLGMSCYNAGRDGNGILLMYSYYSMMSKRYQPKLIIYDLSEFDVVVDDNAKYLEWLRQFYDRPGVDSVVCAINPDERYKMLCRTYRYNGKGLQILSDAIRPMQQDIMGYKPLYGTMAYEPRKVVSPTSAQKSLDPLKKKYLVKFIEGCKKNGTKLVFVVSPSYCDKLLLPYCSSITELCRQYGVPFFYHEADSAFFGNKEYFIDSSHLNNVGAEEFTRMIVGEIKKV